MISRFKSVKNAWKSFVENGMENWKESVMENSMENEIVIENCRVINDV
jgi:hypothetical protein